MDATEKQLLLDIHEKVSATAAHTVDLKALVGTHLADDQEVHNALRTAVSELQGDGKAANLKIKFAIALGLGAGGAQAASSDWLAFLSKFFNG